MSGPGPLAHWLNKLREFCHWTQLVSGPGYRVKQLQGGRMIEWVQQGGGGSGTAAPSQTPLRLMTLVSFAFNYLVCRPDLGASDGSQDVKVALQPELRDTILTQTVAGEAWVYSAYSGSIQQRTATLGSVVEIEYITPRFVAGDRIPVWACANTGIKTDGSGSLTIGGGTVASGGTGYAVSNVLTVAGGTLAGSATAATLTVTAIGAGGAITAVAVASAGGYSVLPPSPNVVTGGSGAGASIKLNGDAPMALLAITGREWAAEYVAPVS
jgi:hypothetical protein